MITTNILLLTTLILYLVGLAFAYTTKNNMVLAFVSILWFVPIVTLDNVFIIIFSVIMFILHISIPLTSEKEDIF